MRILVATDGSPGGRAAVARAILLARQAGAEVVFASVLPHATGTDVVSGEGPRQAGSHESRAAVELAVSEAQASGVRAEYQFLEGNPAEAIVELARARDVDLIVVGSRGLGRVRGALLGSVSQAIVHHADRSVLVVKEPEET
jgi:nucleotide-binding universal stress UspA family protein